MPEEMPPEWMWPFPDELTVWFEEVRAAQKLKYGGDSSEDDEPGDSVGNEYADRFKS